MRALLIKFSAVVAGCFTLLAVGAGGLASAASISNTGAGSTNIIVGGGSGSSISNTGYSSVNVVTNGFCGSGCGGCTNSCSCGASCSTNCNCWWAWSCHVKCWHWE